ncbi:MAG: peroxiredoxin [Pseudomonadota bacterium]
MTLLLGQTVPDFTQESTHGSISFHEWIGDQWCVLFSHPADFTPVCTTELGAVSKLKDEWAARNVQVLALSVDPLDDHKAWIKDIEETQGADIWYPILADGDQKVATLYGMIHPDAAANITVRSVYVIDPNKKLRLTLTYPPSTGRDFREILRTIDSLQLTDGYKVATPVNWQDGDDCIIVPSLTDKAEMDRLFPKGYTEIKPYLRVTPQPNK